MNEEDVIEQLKEVVCSYIVFQQETGGDLGRDHLQGYVMFKSAKTLQAAKAMLPCDAHMEMRMADKISDAVNYCKKDDTRRPGCSPIEVGVQPMDQGVKRTLTDACALAATDGYKAVAKQMPDVYVRFHKGLQSLDNIHAQERVPRHRDVNVIVLYGPSGCGKSWFAEHYDEPDCTYPTGDLKALWMDGYGDERTLVIEEMSGHTPYRELLRLLDGYRYNMPTKGAHVWAHYTTVIITSNMRPEQWYGEDQWSTDARIPPSPLQRRITSIHAGAGIYPLCIWDVPLPAREADAAPDHAVEAEEAEGDVDPLSPMLAEPNTADLHWMAELFLD